METYEYKQLEVLLAKLAKQIKAPRVLIHNGHLQDGYAIAGYDNDGNRLSNKAGATIELAINSSDLTSK